jgi:hypothetical protein
MYGHKPDFEIPENLRSHLLFIDRKIALHNGQLETESHRVIVPRATFVSEWWSSVELALREASQYLEKHAA